MRAWEPFKVVPIRLRGTNKMVNQDNIEKEYGRKQVSRGNSLDTVRGCPLGATNEGYGCPWGCYAKEAVLRYHKIFDMPVSMELREDLLRKDLRELEEDWIRIGVMGEPSLDWPLTLKVAEICHDEGKRVVIVTRLFTGMSDSILTKLSEIGTTLNITMCALDPPSLKSVGINVLRRYRDLGGRAVMRLVTFTFKDERLMEEQRAMLDWGGLVLEQPARLQRTNPTFRLVVNSLYVPAKGYVSPASESRWLTAGPLFNPRIPSCFSKCPDCPHKCLSKGFL